MCFPTKKNSSVNITIVGVVTWPALGQSGLYVGLDMGQYNLTVIGYDESAYVIQQLLRSLLVSS